MQLRKAILFLSLCAIGHAAMQAQDGFPENYAGVWTGTLYTFANSALENQIPVTLTIGPGPEKNIWSWKMEYQSPQNPSVKDYRLIAKSKEMGLYAMDEGSGNLVDATYYNPRLYSVFETNGILLTSVYTMTPDQIVLEVTAGQKSGNTAHVINHPISSLQRGIFTRKK
ncbi:MAG: hypothetical protein R3330_02430 [Saprospiraceae bacterium]|nr:hypothetical protein [Saprospiraceae bacterium]